VGLALGTRLAASGCEVLFVTRRPEQAECIARQGVRLEDPATGACLEAAAHATADLADAASRLVDRPIVFCTRTADLALTAGAISRLAPGALAVAAQNGVDADAVLSGCFARVLGLVVRQTCTRFDDRSVRATGAGRMVVGACGQTEEHEAEAFSRRLARADYDVGVSSDLGADRWLKLCTNLMSTPNALVVRQDHASRAFVETKARLLEEAQAVLAAAGISARSCDGRDRSLEEEIAQQRASLAAGSSARDLPLYNQVWSSLRFGGPLEADGYHRKIIELGAAHGISTPQNERVLQRLLRAQHDAHGPECLRAAELLQGDFEGTLSGDP